jgi:hypothetical protein
MMNKFYSLTLIVNVLNLITYTLAYFQSLTETIWWPSQHCSSWLALKPMQQP